MSAVTTLEAAAVSQASALHGAPREVLSFKLGAEEYGIDILKVQEIRGYESPTRIANAPGFMKGVVNLRGVIVPIVDMRVRFGLEDLLHAGEAGFSECSKIRPAMVHGREVDGPQHAVRDIGRTGDLEEMAAGVVAHGGLLFCIQK